VHLLHPGEQQRQAVGAFDGHGFHRSPRW
jgi:hypothetical protein